MQIALNFTTNSPINVESITGQNKKVYEWLASGKTLNFMQAREMGVGNLQSRIPDLQKLGIVVYRRWVVISGIKYREYSLTNFERV